jgi:uncharacterized protein YjbI with pentapeptide repeats
MKSKILRVRNIKSVILVTILCLSAMPLLFLSEAVAAPTAGAVVEAIDGQAQVSPDTGEELTKVDVGSALKPGDAVTTEQNSKLLLRWDSGLRASLGEFSSILLLPEDAGGPATDIQMTDGILRLSIDPRSGGRPLPFSVTTAVESIEPLSYDEPVDFIVESYEPNSTVITVVAGRVKIRNLAVTPPQEQIVSSCQNVYLEEGQDRPELLSVPPEDLQRLANASTIAGTIAANFDACGAVSTGPPPPPAETPPPPRYAAPPEEEMPPSYGYAYPSMPDYYVEDWDVEDIYPYPEIRVIPPPGPGGEVVVIIPGIGSFYVDLPTYDGWAFDPGVVQLYAGTVFLERVVFFDHRYLRDCRLRQRELRNLMHLAQATGNRRLLMDSRRELDSLNVRANWASRRINRLEGRVAAMQGEQRKFAGKLPRGLNLNEAISKSFNSPKNLPVVQNLQNRVKTELNVQSQLANVAGQEVAGLRAKVAQERDPAKRLALRRDLDKMRGDLAAGKLPLSKNQKDLQNLVKTLGQERDVDKRQKVESQLVNQLQKTGAQLPVGTLSPDKLNALKQDLAKYPNAAQRPDLDRRFAELQQAADARRQEEAGTHKIEELTTQAGQEKDPQKQRDLLGQMNQLLKSPAGIGAAGIGAAGLQLLRQRQNLEQQLQGEKDKQKQETLQRNLEELKKKEAEANLKQQEELRKTQEREKASQQRLKQQKDLSGQAEIKRRQLEESNKELEQRRKHQLDLQKQSDFERQQQLQQRKLEQDRLQQQKLPSKQFDQERLHQDQLRKEKLDQDKLHQQQLQQQQLERDQLRRQKLEQERGSQDQLRRKQLEQEQLRKRQQEQERLKSQQFQQEQMRQKQLQQQQLQQEQLRKQQLQQQQLRQQQLQQEQLRKQQLQQQQLQQQQLQQQQLQQQQLRQQQLQQEQLRQRQLQQQQLQQQQLQQQQLRQQQLKKEQEDKLKGKK